MASAIVLCLICLTFVFITVHAENGISEGRLKIPYGLAIFHSITAIVAVLIIIKIILGLKFIGMLTALFHLFGGIKGLLKYKQFGPEFHHDEIYSHDYPVSYETLSEPPSGPPGYPGVDFGPPSHHYPSRRTQNLEGGRTLTSSGRHVKRRDLNNQDSRKIYKERR